MDEKIEAIIKDGIGREIFPGCSVGIISRTREEKFFSLGQLTYDDNSALVSEDTVYDIASVTKAIPTACLILKYIEEGKLDIDARLVDYLPEFNNLPGKDAVLIRHLLTYTIDLVLPAMSSLKDLSPEEIVRTVLEAPLRSAPGTNYLYTNSTCLLMGLIIKNYLKKDLVSEADKYFFQPLGMEHTTFKPKELVGVDIVPTEEDGWRPGLVHKEVHDEVTWKLQQEFYPGVAGLFSSTRDINKFLKMLLNAGTLNSRKYFEPETIRLMAEKQFSGQEKLSPFGWEPGQKSASSSLESRPLLFGKTGFTGCFVDVDLESGIAVVFLSNRIYPKRPATKDDFIKIREQICEIVFGKE